MSNREISRPVLSVICAISLVGLAGPAVAANYKIDPGHSFVQFRIQHLGYSWLYGRFNKVTGSFKYDANSPAKSEITVAIDPASVDTNHAERDKHLRSSDFLDVKQHPKATFTSTGFAPNGSGGVLTGRLTLLGVTKPITIEVKKIGEGKDPWGGYRAGFIGTTTLDRRDFGMEYNLGPKSWTMELELGIEGIKK